MSAQKEGRSIGAAAQVFHAIVAGLSDGSQVGPSPLLIELLGFSLSFFRGNRGSHIA
jgi:hypothetical protein